MPVIDFSLTDKQLVSAVSLLTRVQKTAKGKDRLQAQRLLGQLEPILHAHQARDHAAQMQARNARSVKDLVDIALSVFPVMKKQGFTLSSLNYIQEVSRAFDSAERRLQRALSEHRKCLPREKRGAAVLPLKTQEDLLQPVGEFLRSLAQLFLLRPVAPAEDAGTYDHASTRTRLAKKCFLSGMAQGHSATQWDELEMAAMCFGDQLSHFQLAAALLAGEPKAIKQASHMDTATRERLADDVWGFVNDGGAKALKPLHSPARMAGGKR